MSRQREDPWAQVDTAIRFSDEALCALANGADEMIVETYALLSCFGSSAVAEAIAASITTTNRLAETSEVSGSAFTLTLPNGMSYRVTVEG